VSEKLKRSIQERNQEISHLLCHDLEGVNELEGARLLNVSVQTLRNWRHLRKGPPYLKIGRRIVYLLTDLRDFQLQNRIEPQGGPQ
jgi:hypothetical protein